MPNLTAAGPLTEDVHRWIGRAAALVDASGDMTARVDWQMAMSQLQVGNQWAAATAIRVTLYRLLGIAELNAPASVKGSFIPAGDGFDAFAAIGKVLQSAKRDILILDPYMDESALTDFAILAPEGIPLRLLSDQATSKPGLSPAATRWVGQYGGARPLAVRLAAPRALHDRAIFLDGSTAWTLTQSLKDFAERSPGEIVRGDDTATLKIAYYEQVWASAGVVV